MSKLGRGLSALIPDKSAPSYATRGVASAGEAISQSGLGVQKIDINSISPNPHQPRKQFNQIALNELADSIKRHGLIQPLTVRPTATGYELVAGERRLRACKIAGMRQVPVLVKEDLTEQDKLELAIIENVQREDLNPVEEAESYQKLKHEFGLSQQEIADRTGKSRPNVANKLRILSLPEQVLEGLRTKKLTEGHARALLPIKDQKKLMAAYRKLLKSGGTVREVEEDESYKTKIRSHNRKIADPEIRSIKDELEEALATKVEIKGKKDKGKITINYFSKGELEDILKKVTGK